MSGKASSSKPLADGRLAVLSPHLDDAVLSTGALLARHPGATVITAFAGRPPGPAPLAAWDADCGFAAGDDVIGARRREDRAALAGLGARPLWLDFCDSQYGATPSRPALAAALRAALEAVRPAIVLFPLGLFHSDHHLLHETALEVAAGRPDLEWRAYEDVPYRALPGLLAARLGRLRQQGLKPRRLPAGRGPAPAVKRRAVACYRSQLRGLATAGRLGTGDVFAPEGYWRMS